MKIIVSPDSFKQCITATQAARAIGAGIQKAWPDAQITEVPMADGGEGTLKALVDATRGETVEIETFDPLRRPVEAEFGVCGGETGVVEMAAASGLQHLNPSEQNPLVTSTHGTGKLIRSALEAGVKEIIVAIGGSATVDGGTGLAEQLGIRFFDAKGKLLRDLCGGKLTEIARFDAENLDPRIKECRISVACDVQNPLTGPVGAAAVYGPQKGATPEQVSVLQKGLENLATVIERETGRNVSNLPGAGAAGGLGAGLVAFLGAELRSGVDTVIKAANLDAKIHGCDLAVTAEGQVDHQSAFGKVPSGIVQLGKKLSVPVVVLAGRLGSGWEKMLENGACAVMPIPTGPMTNKTAMQEAEKMLEYAARTMAQIWEAGAQYARGDKL